MEKRINCINCKWCFNIEPCKKASPDVRGCKDYEKIQREINVLNTEQTSINNR